MLEFFGLLALLMHPVYAVVLAAVVLGFGAAIVLWIMALRAK